MSTCTLVLRDGRDTKTLLFHAQAFGVLGGIEGSWCVCSEISPGGLYASRCKGMCGHKGMRRHERVLGCK